MRSIQNETMKIYSTLPSMGQKSGLFYLYIFEQKRLSLNEKKLITKKHADTHCQMNVLGHSLDEYLKMERIIEQNASSCHRKPRITLVASCTLTKEILAYQKQNKRMHIIKQVFLCFQNDHPQLAQSLKTEFQQMINPQTYSLKQIIGYLENARQNLSFESSTFKNFYQMNQKDKQFSSLRARLRFLACYNIKPNEYADYKKKFRKYLVSIYGLSSSYTNQIMLQLDKCSQQLNKNQIEAFSETILRLYQNTEVHFYKIINEAALKIHQRSFKFQLVALPLSFLFRGIKQLYQKYHDNQLLDSIFGSENCITVYRLAKISKEQIDIFHQRKGCYFQNLAFLSTSLTKKGALKFLVHHHQEQFNYALLQIKLYRHQFNQIQSILPFMCSSFALAPYHNDQREIIINIFSVFVPTAIQEISLPSLKASDKPKNNNWQQFGKHAKLPIISMDCNTFHHKLVNFEEQHNTMSQYERQTIQNYIIGNQRLSKFSDYCMGDAYLDEKKYQQCKLYNKQKQKQLSKINSSQTSNQPNITEVQLIKTNLRLQRRYSDCAYGQGKQHEAVFRLKEILSTKDKTKSMMEHTQVINETVQRMSKISFNFSDFDEAKSVLQTRIKSLRLSIKKQSGPSYKSRFQLVQLLNILGIHYFKRNQIKLARLALRESKRELDFILEELDYQNLKNQTFYILWIVHFFLKKPGKWIFNREDFEKQKRCQNIAEITKDFGIGNCLQDVVERSQQLQKSIKDFLLRRREIIQKSNLTQAEKEIQRKNLFNEVEDQFKDSQILNDLKPNVKQFFQGFERSKKQLKETIQTSINKKINDLQRMIITNCSTSTGAKFQVQYKDILDKKEQIIKYKILDWLKQKKSSISIEEVRQKIDSLIISLRYNYFHLYRKQVKRDYQTTKILMNDTIKIIEEYLSNVKKITNKEPSYQLLFMESKYCQLYIQSQKKSNESEAILYRLIDRAKDNPHYYSILFDSYEKLIYIYESNADISYFKDLDYINKSRNVPLKRQIRTIRKQLIIEGKQIIKKAINQIKKFPKDQFDDKIQQQINSWEIKFRLAKQKFDILGSKLQNDTKTANSLAKQSQLLRSTIQQNSVLIQSVSSNNDSGSIFYKAAHSYNESIFLYDLKIRQSLDKIKQSLKLANQSLPDAQRLKILLAGTYLFSSVYIRDLEQFVKNLIRYEEEMGNYGFYWKISLSLYIYFKFKKDTANMLEFINRTYDFMLNNQQKRTPIFKAIQYEYQQTLNQQSKSFVKSRQTIKPIIPTQLSIDDPQKQKMDLKNTINQENILIQISNQYKPFMVNPEQTQNGSKQAQQDRVFSQRRGSQGLIAFDEADDKEQQDNVQKKYYSLITKKGNRNNKRQINQQYMKKQKPITQRNEINEQDRSIYPASSIQNNGHSEQLVEDQAEELLKKGNRARSSLFLRDNKKQYTDVFEQPTLYSHIIKYSKQVGSLEKQERVNALIQKQEQDQEEMREI